MIFLKKVIKYIMVLSLPSLIFYAITSFYKEETKQVTIKLQETVCIKTIGNKLDQHFQENRDQKIKLYCNCLAASLTKKQSSVISDIGFKDIISPEKAILKLKQLVVQEDMSRMATKCLVQTRQLDLKEHPEL